MEFWNAIVLIVLIGAVSRIACAKYGVVRTGKRDFVVRDHTADAEAARLRDEVRALKERVATLERIATDGNSTLEREIERLRDRA